MILAPGASADAPGALFTGKNGISERPQAFRYPEIQNNSSAEDAQSNAAGILNRSLFLLDFPVRHRYNKGVKG